MQDFRERFKKAITDCLVNPDSPDSHVLETLGGRGTLFEVFHKDEAIRRLDALIAESINNSWRIDRVAIRAQMNIKARKSAKSQAAAKVGTLAEFLGSSALDLLLVERYVKEDEDFYRDLRNVQAWIQWFNFLVGDWLTRTEVRDKQFVEHKKKAKEQIQKVVDLAQRAREKVSKLL